MEEMETGWMEERKDGVTHSPNPYTDAGKSDTQPVIDSMHTQIYCRLLSFSTPPLRKKKNLSRSPHLHDFHVPLLVHDWTSRNYKSSTYFCTNAALTMVSGDKGTWPLPLVMSHFGHTLKEKRTEWFCQLSKSAQGSEKLRHEKSILGPLSSAWGCSGITIKRWPLRCVGGLGSNARP